MRAEWEKEGDGFLGAVRAGGNSLGPSENIEVLMPGDSDIDALEYLLIARFECREPTLR